ncbi:MAG: alpha/beta fold hydrolase [Hydrogenophaga sp.]|uniref:PHA/PHB synthase family protein n=1 Tax=Hydrogenophaga sp. TaxID=1904254 RepID=UPI00260D8D23|nr:alpha/beta fold hydrolase [Hydrogenophaga sp.]MCV0439397.1 alpha/beta fold hydrolase [Hydrogenophaga sp.]
MPRHEVPEPHGPTPIDVPLKLWIARLANGLSPAALAQAQTDWWLHLLVSPARQAQLATSALHKTQAWWHYLWRVSQGPCDDCVTPAPQDKRFSRPEWRQLPFNALAQGFLLQQQWWAEATHGVRGVSRHHEEVTAFVARQWLDMFSPSNFPLTNPQVLQETLRTGGANLASGAKNWGRDALAVATGGKARGVEAFAPGRELALTPGQVVMRNHLVELIQYEPATPTVHREPVLIVPSWIMKYYILDLTPDDSLVRHLVAQGHTVFMVSWRNPGSEDASLGMDDYLQHGVLQALDAVRERCPGAGVHAAGYCLGGTLLAMAAALLGARGEHVLKSVSLLAAQVDFEEPGELGLFIDESQIAFLEDVMAEHGYLDGRRMAGAFQLINSRDLVWSKLVHEYLMGAHTPVTPLRAWNADATRLPARMHSEYLRRLYLRNDLAEGRYRVGDEPIHLDAIRAPLYVLATERDHVSPWTSVYKILRLVQAPASFVLSTGGHNVGIVSPPGGPLAHPEAGYRAGEWAPRQAPDDPWQWFEHAPAHAGSWWPHWQGWLATHSSRRVKARPVAGLRVHGRAVPAPGTYVHGDAEVAP